METCSYEKKLNKIKIVRLTKDVVVQNKDEGTILLSEILEEQMNVSKQIESDKSNNSHSSAEDDSDKESLSSSKSSGNDAVSERNNSVFDDDKDDGSQCNMNESPYYATTESNEKHVSGFILQTNIHQTKKHKEMMITTRMSTLEMNGSGISGNNITLTMILKDQIKETGMKAHTD